MATRRERCAGCNRLLQTPAQTGTVQCPVCQTITGLQPFVDAAVVAHRPRPARLNSVNNGAVQPFDAVAYRPRPARLSSTNSAAGAGCNYYPGTYDNGNGYKYNYVDQPPPQPQRPSRPALAPPSAFGRKRALLCGINYNDTNYSLSGCVNDVKLMKLLLMETLGFPSDCILVLTEEEANPQRIPTKQNLRAALRWLVQDCQPGDSLLFHYSGHGSRQTDYNNDEPDGVDETICPVDYETEGPIIDDEINATIVRPLPRGVVLHAVIDTCYSATVLDLPFVCRMNREGYYMWEDQRTRAFYKGTSGGLALSLSACDDHQTSATTNTFRSRELSGAMTTSFVHAVQNEPGLTYGCLLNSMRIAIPTLISDPKVSQEPQLSSSKKFDIYSKQFML
ncbi:Metacaspase-1 like [Melia azedarach]|uniref:Metacaspase-1 like n=1 Tax=Melia azedarach TaxID=155640 RepID=A0ACC1Y121_MELAZ|nr:Metacaspase-1 like [Melia azedarach]